MRAVDHPYTDPGDGRTECEVCGKFVWLVTHSCKRVPVTDAARARVVNRYSRSATGRPVVLKCQAMTTPSGVCDVTTPGGPCVLGAGHPVHPSFPGWNGHMSQAHVDDNEWNVATGGQDVGSVSVGGEPVPGAVEYVDGVIVVDLSVVADAIEAAAHARGERAPWESGAPPVDVRDAVPNTTMASPFELMVYDDEGVEVGTSVGPFEPGQAVTSFDVLEPDDQCVAATGRPAGAEPCRVHADGAHHCHRSPEHQAAEGDELNLLPGRSLADHICDCGFVWLSLRGGAAQQSEDLRAADEAGAARALRRAAAAVRVDDDFEAAGCYADTVEWVAKQMGVEL